MKRLLALSIFSVVVCFSGWAATPEPATQGWETTVGLISAGDTAGVRRMLEAEPILIRGRTFEGWTLLHITIMDGQENALDICSLLVAKGVDLSAADSEGNTALHFSVYRMGREKLPEETYTGIIKLLLENGANVGARNSMDATPMHSAVIRGGDAAALHLLLAKGADVNAKASQGGGWTPLHGAAATGRADLVRVLLKNGGDSRARDGLGRTPLEVAEEEGHGGVARLLRQHDEKSGH